MQKYVQKITANAKQNGIHFFFYCSDIHASTSKSSPSNSD